MKKEMLINCLQSEEIRIAILEDGVLEELYVERTSAESYVGNIYKGRVVNIEPSIQAAFVDFGVGRNGFLHVSDVEPAYYREQEERGSSRRGGRDDRRGDRDRGRGPRRQDPYDAPRQPYPAEPKPISEGFGFPSEPEPIHQRPIEMLEHEGPDIIVEQIVEEDEEFDPQVTMMEEPADMEDESPIDAEISNETMLPPDLDDDLAPPPAESSETPAEPKPEPNDVAPTALVGSPAVTDEAAPSPTTDAAGSEEKDDDDKPRKRSPRGTKAKPRARKPRKRSGKDESEEPAGEGAEAAAPAETAAETPPPASEVASPSEEPRPRPMESTERRTDGDEHGHFSIEPRPASDPREISDEDLSFSMAPRTPLPPPPVPATASFTPPPPPPAPPPITQPESSSLTETTDEPQVEFAESSEISDDGSIIETFVEDEFDDEPLPPAIPKTEPIDTFAELSEEEKNLEEADAGQSSERFDDERHADYDDEFSNTEAFAPRQRGRGGRTGGRDRGGDRGGRGRGDRDRRGGRGGRTGGRDADRGGHSGPFARPKPNIEDIFKRGQEVIVQVIKEGLGTKGPTLSTYISIAGRYLVLMPGLNRIGVSRKIENEESRRRLRDIMNELRPPKGVGFIIRTAGQDRDAKELQGDLAYLSRLWEVVVRRVMKQKSPTEVYRESDMVTRTIRDIFAGDITTIWVDERGAYEAAKEFMEAVMPKFADRIKFYDGTEPMFSKYGVESEMARIQQRKVPLPHGGSIVIDQTEALVAIDVNSGNFRASNNDAEETAYQMNLHAAKEIARQLRLRDLGGVIANDFIDMREERHRRNVEKALRDAVERDRARTKILRISQFGIIEMTRQRIRPSLKRSAFQDCTHCRGTGHVKTCESVSIEVMRMLQSAVNRLHINRIDVRVHEEAAQYLLNRKRKQIVGLEDQGNKSISIISAGNAVSPEFLEFLCFDNNGNEVKFSIVEEPPQRPQHRRRY